MSSEEELTKYEPFSNKRMLAFALNLPILNTLWSLRNWLQLYSAKALGIPIWYVLMIFGIYVLWDAINDPLTGNLLDRSSKFTSKYGKRFPFITIGIFGALLCLTMLYLPVTSDPLLAAFWILFVIILYDAFQTMYELSVSGFRVDRFRDQKQRVKYGTYSHILAGICTILTAIFIPLLLGMYGGVSSSRAYFFMALTVIIALLIAAIPQILSSREPKEMIEFRSKLDIEKRSSSPPKEMIKRAFKDRNWMGVVLAYVTWVVEIGCITVGLGFYIVDGLGLPISMIALPTLSFLLVGFAVIPLWMKIAKKLGSKKTYFYALICTAITTASFIFATNYTLVLIFAALGGIGHGGQGVILTAILSEAIDNATLKNNVREESSYHGILRFFSATAIFWQVLIFTIVGTITGYDPALGTKNSDFAKLGLNLQMSLIPATIMVISALIFHKLYTVTKEIAIENKAKLIELNL
jgi:GPH family glycoside/pentoside/hexuronide:cation symporter